MGEYHTEFGIESKRGTISPLSKKWFFLGYTRANNWPVYLEDFKWDCGWYWAGGYVVEPNNQVITDIRSHTHFDGFGRLPDRYDTQKEARINGQGCCMFDGFKARIAKTPLTKDQLWRLCDLMVQFYAYKEAAECFRYGGHMTSEGRTDAEISPHMVKQLNKQIEDVIIPEVRKIFGE